jgi:uncharacterized UPF0160 family protein
MKVATHDGSFHADEAFAVAVLQLAHGTLEVVRTRDAAVHAAADVRVDVGMRSDPATGDFDHHQKGGAGERPNGIRYASFGLVWRELGRQLCGADAAVADKVDRVLVQGIDAHDNGQTLTGSLIDGVQPMTVGQAVSALNPLWDEDVTPAGHDALFARAVAMATAIVEREIAAASASARSTNLVRSAIGRAPDPRIIELDRGMPWHEAVVTEAPEALFVVYPKTDGWGLQAVPRELGSFGNRKDLPAAWAGRTDADLAAVTGVPDAVFCHSARFIAVASSREGVGALARKALDHSDEPEAGSE